jgi:hypothetical protein
LAFDPGRDELAALSFRPRLPAVFRQVIVIVGPDLIGGHMPYRGDHSGLNAFAGISRGVFSLQGEARRVRDIHKLSEALPISRRS